MKRIFTTLAFFSTALLIAAFVLGLSIDDVTAAKEATRSNVRWHFLTALAALCFATLVHAIWLTYIMGTGRWLEETCRAYRLERRFQAENRSLKYGTIPLMVGAFLLLLATGGFGAAVDPGSSVNFTGWAGMSGATIHFLLAVTALGVNVIVNLWESQTITRNGELIDDVLRHVKQIREQRGLPV